MLRVNICAVGRLRTSPEKDLIDDYLSRADKTGRSVGICECRVLEVEDKKASGKQAEAALLTKAVPSGSITVALDERGKVLTSPEFSQKLAAWRDDGQQSVCFLIGGAAGLAPELLQSVDFKLSFGRMVWPHILARVMLAEQIYRATTILTNGPYHKS